jgi:putative spermidine/putrescine transport system substrate-binding protein
MTDLSRREVLCGAASLGAFAAIPGAPAWSQAGNLVAHTFPPPFQDLTQQIWIPEFKRRTKGDVTLTTMLAVDAVTRLVAAKGGQPPLDVVLLDQGPLLDAIKAGVLAEYRVAQSEHFKDLLPVAQDKWGPKFTMQMIGISYNPKKVKTPPKSWNDLWSGEYKGRVGLTALNSSLGTAFLAELSRVRGGSESDIEPAFKALREILPNVGAISANLGAHATLFQQEQVDIAPNNFNFVETLKGRGVSIEFVVPDTGLVGWTTSMHVAANSDKADLAFQYIEGALSPEVQGKAQSDPWWVIPTNSKVETRGPVKEKLGASTADIGSKFRVQDWAIINAQRSAWIERFNREIRL